MEIWKKVRNFLKKCLILNTVRLFLMKKQAFIIKVIESATLLIKWNRITRSNNRSVKGKKKWRHYNNKERRNSRKRLNNRWLKHLKKISKWHLNYWEWSREIINRCTICKKTQITSRFSESNCSKKDITIKDKIWQVMTSKCTMKVDSIMVR